MRMPRIPAGILTAVCLSPCAVSARWTETVDRIVAVVNEDIITLYDVDQVMRPMIQNMRSQGHVARARTAGDRAHARATSSTT